MLKRIKSGFEAAKLARAAAMLCGFVFLNNLQLEKVPFSSALYAALSVSGYGVFGVGAVFLLSAAVTFSAEFFLSALAQTAVLCVIYGTFQKKKIISPPSLLFLPISLVPYILMNTDTAGRIFDVLIITAMALVFYPFCSAARSRKMRKPNRTEWLSFALLYVIAACGGIKYLGGDVYKSIAIIIIMTSAIAFKGREIFAVALAVAIPSAINAYSLSVIPPFLLFAGASVALCGGNRVIYAMGVMCAELASAYVFRWYEGYDYFSLLYPCVAILIVVPIPNAVFSSIENHVLVRENACLSRRQINRTRTLISGRLYEISGTFKEIADLFTKLGEKENPFIYEQAIVSEVENTCKACAFEKKCRSAGFPEKADLMRLIAIAKGKGRLTAVDMPKSFTSKCSQTGKIIFAINKYVSLYGAEMDKFRAEKQTRELVAVQAEGVSAALKGLAVSYSRSLEFNSAEEKSLCRKLNRHGFAVREIMVFGEGREKEIHLTLPSDVSEKGIEKIITAYLCTPFCLTEKFSLDGVTACVYAEEGEFDCAFGVATMPKDGEGFCGDTHSLIKISQNKLLLALADGMGSGEQARATSSASLSLIECLFRSGVPAEVALNAVNRLLSFSNEENFAALDVGVLDLESLTCNFIKLGAPYGFILSGGRIRLIEGSSLPMGILGQIKPAVCSEELCEGDVIMFLSDGVTDAFGSATDFADFLAAVDISNPQKLADKVVQEAFALYGNKAADDMTAVACRVFAPLGEN